LDVPGEGSEFDVLVRDGDEFFIGDLTCRVMATPGHTPACVTFLIGTHAFVGDTLFMPDYGTARADFPGGDARQLYRSIHKLLTLPKDTKLHLCHDYLPKGRSEYCWETTVADELEHNVHVKQNVTEDEFVAMREARDKTLAAPALLMPSIQVNMRAGKLPPPDSNGVHYIHVPIDLPHVT
jgi:glyoxylase-like metal-dependent hydrolase (beta-lactamase superfamily II)